MELKYTNEKAVLLLIAVLKANGIKRVVVSPGTTNFTFVGSIQHDDFFQLYSCIDERSAAYIACGIATETGEPVVITCTGATAPRNYLPGLTEAYYRKLPILAVCGHRGESAIGHLHDQQLDRRQEPVDVANEQVWLPFVKDKEDEQFCYNEIIKAVLSLYKHGGGPALINLCTHYSPNMSIQDLPDVCNVTYYAPYDLLPELPHGRIAITLGSHKKFTIEETKLIDAFCASYDAVVFCDHTSGYYGKYAVHPSLQFCQNRLSNLAYADICINAGEVSGDEMGVLRVWAPVTWRIGEDGIFRNRTNNVSKIFDMPLAKFCQHYIVKDSCKETYLHQCLNEYEEIHNQIPELPFSNVWIAQQLSSKIPMGSSVYLGIYNSLRSWNLFNLPPNVDSMSNVGGFGIDGILSSAVGRSIANSHRLTYCILGDLSFYYDMNSLGNRHVSNNLRVLIINNGLGDEFRQYNNPAYRPLGEEVRPYIAAEGHYISKSQEQIKAYVESLGYKYLSASSKDEFIRNVPLFISSQVEQSIIFEVRVDAKDDTDAMKMVSHIWKGETPSLKKRVTRKIKSMLSEEKVNAIRTLLK